MDYDETTTLQISAAEWRARLPKVAGYARSHNLPLGKAVLQLLDKGMEAERRDKKA